MKNSLLLSVLLVLSSHLIAQKDYQAGSITRMNNLIETGFIENREWVTNPKKIKFKKTEDDRPVELGLMDILAFEITGKDRYQRAIVVKDVRPVTVEDLNDFPGEPYATDTAFLRELFRNDTIGVYILHDFKDHFFIKERMGKWVELKYSLDYNRANSTYNKNNAFQNQLLNYFPDKKEDAAFVNYIEHLAYDEKDITGFFYKATNTTVAKKKKNPPVFFAGVGVQSSNLKVSGNTPIADETYKSSMSPLFFVGMDLGSSRNLNEFVLRVQLEYNSYDFKGQYSRFIFPSTIKEESYQLQMSNIKTSVALLYNYIRKNNNRAYLGMEPFLNLSTYKKNVFTRSEAGANTTVIDDYYAYEKSWIGVNAATGFILKNKFDLSATYLLVGSFSKLVGVGIKPTVVGLRLGYRF